ncbi:MAG: FtsX-like permease family protein [Actinomycetota bacterium]
MTTLLFLLKRFLAQRLLSLAIVVTLGFTIGVLVAGPIYADAAREAILSSEVSTAGTTVRNVRLTVYGNEDFPYVQTDERVIDALRVLPLESIVRQGRGTVRLAGPDEDAAPISLTMLFRDGAAEHLRRYRGEPPATPQEVALPGGVARLLGVAIGEPLTALGPGGGQAQLTLVGTYEPPGGDDEAFWFGGQAPFPPPDSTQLPPALMDTSGYLATVPALGVTTEYVWDGYVRYEGLEFDRARALPSGIRRVDRSLREANPELAGLRTTSGIETMVEIVRQRVADLRVPILLVVFQIGAVTLAVLAGVGSLVLTRQSFELAVLRSRGFSGRKLLSAQAVQAVLSAIVAFPIGLLLGMALASLASRSNGPSLPGVLFPIRLSAFANALGVVGAVVGAVVLLLLSLPHVKRTILEERRLLSREDRPLLARVPVEVFVLPVAAFAFVQLRSSDIENTASRTDLDPLVLLTPTMIIFALSFLSLRVLLFTLRRLDRRVGRSRRLSMYLAARRLGRSPGTSFATSLVLVLSVGLLVVSTSYRAIVLRNHEDSARHQVGSDWNIQIAVPEQPLAALVDLPADATAVIRTEPQFELPGNFALSPSALAVDPTTFGAGGWWRDDYATSSLSAWLGALETPDPAVPVEGESLSAEVTAEDAQGVGLELIVTYETADRRILESSAGVLADGTATYEAAMPDATGLLSLTFREPEVADLAGAARIGIRDVTVGGASVPLGDWEPLTWRGSDGEVTPQGDGVRVVVDPGAGHIVGGIAGPMPPIPALVSRQVASSQGTEFDATLGAQRLTFRVAGIAEHFPSVAGDFMVVSTPALLLAAERIPEVGLSLNEVWVTGEEDPRPALEEGGFLTGNTRSAGPIIGELAQLPQSLAVGMNFAAAAGGLGLVVIGVGVGLYFAQRRREFEFASLRAMGAEPRQISRVLLLEQGAMIVFAIVVGAGIGFGILTLVMPYVGRSIGAAFPEPILVVDWLSMGIALAAIVAATAVGLLAALRSLVRSSVTSVLRGEAE